MRIIDLKQGSAEWLKFRAKYHTASEASMMKGASKNVTRNQMLHMKATGTDQEFSDWVKEHLLDRGHEIEEAARPIAEKIIGSELYPVVAVDDDDFLLASYDGLDFLEELAWECKSWNAHKVAEVKAGRVPEEDRWQVVQQLSLGVSKVLYMVTDGTPENTVHIWVEPNPQDQEELLASWVQFDKDLASYEPQPEEVKPEVKAIMELPALSVAIRGEVSSSNLALYQETALAFIENINTDLATDDDFVQAENTIKFCKSAEDELDAVKKQALSKTADIDTLFRTVDHLKEEMRQKRLTLSKLVKVKKDSIRIEMLQAGKTALNESTEELEQELGGFKLPDVPCDLPGAIKGKRTIASLQNAIDTAVAETKIEQQRIAAIIRKNVKKLSEEAEYNFLFNDAQALIAHDSEHFSLIVSQRITAHKQAEERRLQDERDRIRAEEERRAQEQERARAAAAEEKRRAEERIRLDAEAREHEQIPVEAQTVVPPEEMQPYRQKTEIHNDKRLRAQAINAATEALIAAGVTKTQASLAIRLIVDGEIPGVSITF